MGEAQLHGGFRRGATRLKKARKFLGARPYHEAEPTTWGTIAPPTERHTLTDEKKKPWGDAYSVKPGRDSGDGEVGRDIWIPLGPVWESEQGNFSFTLDSEPIHWRNPNVERRVVITRRQATPATQPTTSKGGGGRK